MRRFLQRAGAEPLGMDGCCWQQRSCGILLQSGHFLMEIRSLWHTQSLGPAPGCLLEVMFSLRSGCHWQWMLVKAANPRVRARWDNLRATDKRSRGSSHPSSVLTLSHCVHLLPGVLQLSPRCPQCHLSRVPSLPCPFLPQLLLGPSWAPCLICCRCPAYLKR